MKRRFQVCWGIVLLSLLTAKPVLANTLLITNPTSISSTLELDGTRNPSTSIVKIADIHISTDNPQGCTVTISSGSLSKPGGTSIPFQIIDVADGAETPSAGSFTAASGSNHTFNLSTAGTGDRDIYIRYTPATLQDPGRYSASITVTASDN
jgi:hypothetical protein